MVPKTFRPLKFYCTNLVYPKAMLGCWGPQISFHLVLFSITEVVLAQSMHVHSFIMSSGLFFCLHGAMVDNTLDYQSAGFLVFGRGFKSWFCISMNYCMVGQETRVHSLSSVNIFFFLFPFTVLGQKTLRCDQATSVFIS